MISWEKLGLGEDGLPPHVTNVNGTLQFNGVESADKGKYICTARNSQGVVNATIFVDVVGEFDVRVQMIFAVIDGVLFSGSQVQQSAEEPHGGGGGIVGGDRVHSGRRSQADDPMG